ncbi:MAG: hypothetical protein RMM17_06915 [Acidobacteriota bacterium]|nr:hypothetical protein [Blastocatellia bacterium]MDW8412395.1 hypothetical protein [Acidobacteriota bacterium]
MLIRLGKRVINISLVTEVIFRDDGDVIVFFAAPDSEGQSRSIFRGEEAVALRRWLENNSVTIHS